MELTYLAQPPKRYTFEQPKLKEWVESWCQGRVLNLFAGRVKLNVNETRNDIDNDMPADYHCDAYDFVQLWSNRVKDMPETQFDTVILDPPYNIRKAREIYGGRYIGSFTKIKNKLSEILSYKARVITLGYDTVGMSKSRGFKKLAVCVICHGGDHNDTLCLVEQGDYNE